MDITKYPEAVDEIIKYMDYMPGATDEEKKTLFMGFISYVLMV